MRRMAIAIIVDYMPLIITVVGGMLTPRRTREEYFFRLAERVDRTARGLHDRIADELDRLAVSNR
jgi:hypothetical protein